MRHSTAQPRPRRDPLVAQAEERHGPGVAAVVERFISGQTPKRQKWNAGRQTTVGPHEPGLGIKNATSVSRSRRRAGVSAKDSL